MWPNEELFEKYDLLQPAKNNGGLLYIALYQKIKSRELDRHFTTNDIKIILSQLAEEYSDTLSQSERIIKHLLHFFLRNVPGDPGKYYLTDFAEELIELLQRKLEKPYKNYPLKQSFSRYFTIGATEIQGINDLERKFGREFVAPHKHIINDHLATLDDELRDATDQLNTILHSEEESATVIVRNFVNVFRKFGEKAEDITNAIADKDQFLRSLRMQADGFYSAVGSYKHPETAEEIEILNRLKRDWEMAAAIVNDLEEFFRSVDEKIGTIRRQILFASEKLSELHENLSSRSRFRLLIKKMLSLALASAEMRDKEIRFHNGFPSKILVYEKTQLFYPARHDFELPRQNNVIQIERDEEYERTARLEIERDIKRQEIINQWIMRGKRLLEETGSIGMGQLIGQIMSREGDLALAHSVAIELTQFVAESEHHDLVIEQTAETVENTTLIIWKMQLMKLGDTISLQKTS
jgi:hypothetical protein